MPHNTFSNTVGAMPCIARPEKPTGEINKMSGITKARRRSRRSQTGQAMTELPGALLILLLMIFFPLVALLSIGFSYGCCATLNSLQLHEAALVSKTEAQKSTGQV